MADVGKEVVGHTATPWDALVKALKNIEGGYFDGAGTLAVNGGWKDFTERLQAIAREALTQAGAA